MKNPNLHEEDGGERKLNRNMQKTNLRYFFIIMQGTGYLGLLLAGHLGTLIGCFDHTWPQRVQVYRSPAMASEDTTRVTAIVDMNDFIAVPWHAFLESVARQKEKKEGEISSSIILAIAIPSLFGKPRFWCFDDAHYGLNLELFMHRASEFIAGVVIYKCKKADPSYATPLNTSTHPNQRGAKIDGSILVGVSFPSITRNGHSINWDT